MISALVVDEVVFNHSYLVTYKEFRIIYNIFRHCKRQPVKLEINEKYTKKKYKKKEKKAMSCLEAPPIENMKRI